MTTTTYTPRHRKPGDPQDGDRWYDDMEMPPEHAAGEEYNRWFRDPCMSCSEHGPWHAPRNREPATETTDCGIRVCHGCHQYVMGRITCPWHGDSH